MNTVEVLPEEGIEKWALYWSEAHSTLHLGLDLIHSHRDKNGPHPQDLIRDLAIKRVETERYNHYKMFKRLEDNDPKMLNKWQEYGLPVQRGRIDPSKDGKSTFAFLSLLDEELKNLTL